MEKQAWVNNIESILYQIGYLEDKFKDNQKILDSIHAIRRQTNWTRTMIEVDMMD